MLYSGKSCSTRARLSYSGKVVVFGQNWLYSGKEKLFGKGWFYSGNSVSIRAKAIVVRQWCLYSDKLVVFWAKVDVFE